MSTETFKARHIETREDSVKVEHLGKTVFLPRSQIERMSVVGDRVDLTIPYWLFKAKFED